MPPDSASPPGRPTRPLLAGVLLSLAVAAAVLHAFWPAFPRLVSGLAGWGAGLLLWPGLPVRTRRQVLALLAVGVAGLAWGWSRGVAPDLAWALSANAALIAMLAAVSFLRLVSDPGGEGARTLPTGPRALGSTLLGVHLFGAVINLSTVFIMGDRLERSRGLERRAVMVLVRGFAAAAHWSPFFAAMAAALTFAPGAQLQPLMAVGVPLAAVALLMTLYDARRVGGEPFTGYPMNLRGLWLPGLLAVAVLAAHVLAPALPVLGIITLFAPALALGVMLLRGREGRVLLARHVGGNLPRMGNELALFLAAGVMAAGLGSVFTALGGWVPFTGYGVMEAGITLAVMVAIALVGVHPVIGVAAFGTLLAPLHPDPNLLAMTFLAAWSLGVSSSPFSGMNLALQGRYGVPALDFLRWNLFYSVRMIAVTVAAMAVYVALRG